MKSVDEGSAVVPFKVVTDDFIELILNDVEVATVRPIVP
jgi:hypothetical protein